jgi:hypothetical protein
MLRRWVAYYLILLASLVFALMYPGRVSSAFFYALLLLPLASLLISSLLLIGFSYKQNVDRLAATKGETVTFRLTLRNKSPLMLPFIEASFYGAGSFFAKDFGMKRLAALPMKRTSISIKLDCRYKGIYEIGVKQIKLSDYLGLFTFRQGEALLGTLTVYPRIVPIECFPAVAGYPGESLGPAGRSHDSTENVSDIRKYVSGDRLRAVHWKLSAKKEELMVRSFEQTTGLAVDLVLDASGISEDPAEGIPAEDRFVECAVSLAHHFATNSIPAVLYYYSGRLVKHRLNNISDFQLAYKMLSEAVFSREPCLMDIAGLVLDEGVKRKTVAVVTAALTEGLACQALRLKLSGFNMIVVQVPSGKEEKADEGELERLRALLLDSGVSLYVLGADDDIGTALARRAV